MLHTHLCVHLRGRCSDTLISKFYLNTVAAHPVCVCVCVCVCRRVRGEGEDVCKTSHT